MSEYGQFWPIGGGEGLPSSNLAPESNGVESKRAFSVPEPSSERYFGGGGPTRLYGSSTDLSGSDGSQGSTRIVPQPSLTSSVSYNNLLNMPALEQPTRYLWVGALSQKASRPALCALMERFGPLEDVVCVSCRSLTPLDLLDTLARSLAPLTRSFPVRLCAVRFPDAFTVS